MGILLIIGGIPPDDVDEVSSSSLSPPVVTST